MLVCAFFCATCTRDRGCSVHPAFPAPSVWRVRKFDSKPRAQCAARMRSCVIRHCEERSDEAIHSAASGQMDCFASLAMTWMHTCSFSRRVSPEVFQIRWPSPNRGRRESRVPTAPAVSCAKRTVIDAHEHTGSAETLRHPPRNGFTAYIVLSPVSGLFCHRHPREACFPGT